MFRWAEDFPKETKPTTVVDPRLRMIKWFAFDHIPESLQKVSAIFNGVAAWMMTNLPPGPEATEAMRKLLESKDCAVRAAIESDQKKGPIQG